MKVIVLTACSRPEYTRRLLRALDQCYGVDEYYFIVSLDYIGGVSEEVKDICYSWLKIGKGELFVNDPPYGIDTNKIKTFEKAYAISEYVIHLEDDIIPARDCLRYFEWGNERFKSDKRILAINSYNKYPSGWSIDLLYSCFVSNSVNVWGWGIWKDRWEELMSSGKDFNSCFDARVLEYLEEKHMLFVHPVIARSQNIGEIGGVHTNRETFKNDYNESGAWDVTLEDPLTNIWHL
jgi:hypothetical protein